MDAIRGRNDRQSASSLVERCLVSYHRLAPCCLILQLMSAPVAYDAERKRLLETPTLPKWAIPEGVTYTPPVSQDEVERVAADRGLPQPQAQPATRRSAGNGDPAKVVIKFGKHQGKTLGQILAQDKGYLEWLAEKSSNQFIAGKARQLLEAQPAPAEPETAEAEAEPHDLPVAAAPEPATVNGNGHNADDTFGDFDEIPF